MLTLTKSARQHLKKVAHEKQKHLLFACKGDNCEGFEYVWEETQEPLPVNKYHRPVALQNGYTVSLCSRSMFFLLGTHVDWQEETFTYVNPNAKKTHNNRVFWPVDTLTTRHIHFLTHGLPFEAPRPYMLPDLKFVSKMR